MQLIKFYDSMFIWTKLIKKKPGLLNLILLLKFYFVYYKFNKSKLNMSPTEPNEKA